MFAITGAFGQTGSALCEALLSRDQKIRLLVRRDDEQADSWRARGAEIAIVDLADQSGLTQALREVDGAYLMNPPAYMHADLFAQARIVHKSLVDAANAAHVPHVVALSSVGAHQAKGTGNILTTWDYEQQLDRIHSKLTILRAANFMENWAWSLKPVIEDGVLPSMFLPIKKAIPMVSAIDIGQAVATCLMTPPAQKKLIELHGPHDYSPTDAAYAFSELLGKNVLAVEAKESGWPDVFRGVGFPPVTVKAFCDMFHGFNDETIVFQGTHETVHRTTDLKTALGNLLKRAHDSH